MSNTNGLGAGSPATQSGGEGSADNFIEIPLGEGLVALVDGRDGHLARWSWVAKERKGRTYATRSVGRKGGHDTFLLHREVLGLRKGDGREVDHINGDPLDCRRENLRVVTRLQNVRNRRKLTPGFKGVVRRSATRWVAAIRMSPGRQTHLGSFSTAEAAAHAYDDAARKHFGEYACVNFPRPGERGCRPEAA